MVNPFEGTSACSLSVVDNHSVLAKPLKFVLVYLEVCLQNFNPTLYVQAYCFLKCPMLSLNLYQWDVRVVCEVTLYSFSGIRKVSKFY